MHSVTPIASPDSWQSWVISGRLQSFQLLTSVVNLSSASYRSTGHTKLNSGLSWHGWHRTFSVSQLPVHHLKGYSLQLVEQWRTGAVSWKVKLLMDFCFCIDWRSRPSIPDNCLLTEFKELSFVYYSSHACHQNYNCRFCDGKMYLCINNGNGTGSGVVLAGTGTGWEREKRHGNGTGSAFPCKTLVQTTPVLGDLHWVSSLNCDIAERKHAVKAYSGPLFVHPENFKQIGTISSLWWQSQR